MSFTVKQLDTNTLYVDQVVPGDFLILSDQYIFFVIEVTERVRTLSVRGLEVRPLLAGHRARCFSIENVIK